jgi:hypothetical protein
MSGRGGDNRGMWPCAFTLFLVVAGAFGAGCGGNYCQSGAKHGTQCYEAPQGDEPPTYAGGSDQEESSKRPEIEPGRTLPATAPR